MPRDAWKPRQESIQFFEKVLRTHGKVSRFRKRDAQVFEIERDGISSSIVVLLTDLYTVGLADVVQAQDVVDDLDCIVTMSNWNGYTREGKEHAKEHRIGLFLLSEFMGSLWKKDFWDYVKLDENGRPILHYRSQSA